MNFRPTKWSPKSWLAFDLNVLRRLEFDIVALPSVDKPMLGLYLKRLGARVLANDPLRFAWAKAFAEIVNPGFKLSPEQIDSVLEDAYVPGYRLDNQGLTNWFSETDAWWFDNVRRNIDRLDTDVARTVAMKIALETGDYVTSFTEETRELRQPLSGVFRRLCTVQPEPYDNGQRNTCVNKNGDDFIAETHADLMFLRLPSPHSLGLRGQLGRTAWKEEWVRGTNDFWGELDSTQSGRLGSPTETKSQYLHLLQESLNRASHIRKWAIAHVEDGFIQTQDIVETIGSIRRVDAIYTKDLSELTGSKAVIITA